MWDQAIEAKRNAYKIWLTTNADNHKQYQKLTFAAKQKVTAENTKIYTTN